MPHTPPPAFFCFVHFGWRISVTTNFITGILSIALGLFYTITAMLLPKMTLGDKLGPKVFPYVVGTIAIITGIALLLQDRNPAKKSKKAEFGFVKYKSVWIRIALISIAGIVFGLIIDSVGYMLSTAAFMFVVSILINKKRYVQNLIIAVLFAVITYFVFAVALKLSLPRGFLEQLLPF